MNTWENALVQRQQRTLDLAINPQGCQASAWGLLFALQVAIASKDPPGLNPNAPIAWDKKNKIKR